MSTKTEGGKNKGEGNWCRPRPVEVEKHKMSRAGTRKLRNRTNRPKKRGGSRSKVSRTDQGEKKGNPFSP